MLLACHRGDDRAAARLHARHGPPLLAYARTILHDELLAEDAVQGAFCRILERSRRELRGIEQPRAWLAAIVRNEALQLLRARGRAERRRRRAAVGPAATDVRAGDDVEALRAAIAALPRRLREVVALRHAAGLSFDAIAETLAAPRGTVDWRYRRAIAELRTRLADDDTRPETRRDRGAGALHHA